MLCRKCSNLKKYVNIKTGRLSTVCCFNPYYRQIKNIQEEQSFCPIEKIPEKNLLKKYEILKK